MGRREDVLRNAHKDSAANPMSATALPKPNASASSTATETMGFCAVEDETRHFAELEIAADYGVANGDNGADENRGHEAEHVGLDANDDDRDEEHDERKNK